MMKARVIMLRMKVIVMRVEVFNLAKTIYEIYRRSCKSNLTNLRRELYLSLAKGNPK
jgi:hypothetical protein